MNLFRREKFELLPMSAPAPVSLANEAMAVVGDHAVQRSESMARLEELESRLDANIRLELEVLAAVRTELARERAAATGQAFAAVEHQIETAINEIELDMVEAPTADEISLIDHDQVADEIDRNLKDRRNGTERRPKRASEKQLATA